MNRYDHEASRDLNSVFPPDWLPISERALFALFFKPTIMGLEMDPCLCQRALVQSGQKLSAFYRTLAWWLECFPRAQETWVQSQVETYQILKKWYLMPPCLTISIIRYGSRVKWSNLGKGVMPSPTPRCGSNRKGAFGSPSTAVANFTYLCNKWSV